MQKSGARACYVDVWGPPIGNTDGEPNPQAVYLRSIWVSMYPVRPREEMDYYGERMAVVVYRARADFYDAQGIDETMEFRYEGLHFGINAIHRDLVTKADTDFDLREQRLGA